MTKFVVDAGVAVRLVSEGIEVANAHTLLPPTLLRSETLSALHEAVARGEITTDRHIWRFPWLRSCCSITHRG